MSDWASACQNVRVNTAVRHSCRRSLCYVTVTVWRMLLPFSDLFHS